jgi:hypothetical protein
MLLVFFVDLAAYGLELYPPIKRCDKSYDPHESEINNILYYSIRVIQGLFAIIFLIVFCKLCQLRAERKNNILNAKLLVNNLQKEKSITWKKIQ